MLLTVCCSLWAINQILLYLELLLLLLWPTFLLLRDARISNQSLVLFNLHGLLFECTYSRAQTTGVSYRFNPIRPSRQSEEKSALGPGLVPMLGQDYLVM